VNSRTLRTQSRNGNNAFVISLSLVLSVVNAAKNVVDLKRFVRTDGMAVDKVVDKVDDDLLMVVAVIWF
jgi:hypothetical protein